jgi:hypothetical protein
MNAAVLLKVCITLLIVNLLLVFAFRFITNYHDKGLKNKKTIVLGVLFVSLVLLIKFSGFVELYDIEKFFLGKLNNFIHWIKSLTICFRQ